MSEFAVHGKSSDELMILNKAKYLSDFVYDYGTTITHDTRMGKYVSNPLKDASWPSQVPPLCSDWTTWKSLLKF
jgi:hypothetical protein